MGAGSTRWGWVEGLLLGRRAQRRGRIFFRSGQLLHRRRSTSGSPRPEGGVAHLVRAILPADGERSVAWRAVAKTTLRHTTTSSIMALRSPSAAKAWSLLAIVGDPVDAHQQREARVLERTARQYRRAGRRPRARSAGGGGMLVFHAPQVRHRHVLRVIRRPPPFVERPSRTGCRMLCSARSGSSHTSLEAPRGRRASARCSARLRYYGAQAGLG